MVANSIVATSPRAQVTLRKGRHETQFFRCTRDHRAASGGLGQAARRRFRGRLGAGRRIGRASRSDALQGDLRPRRRVVKVRFTLDVELFDIVEGERLKMRARGKAPGSNVDVVSALQVEDAGNGHTRLNWSATSDVSGTMASVGARLLEGTARRLTEQFWTDFAQRVSAGYCGCARRGPTFHGGRDRRSPAIHAAPLGCLLVVRH